MPVTNCQIVVVTGDACTHGGRAQHGCCLVCSWCYCVLKQDEKLSQSQDMLALMVAVRIMDAV
jgi:hypothetical protein